MGIVFVLLLGEIDLSVGYVIAASPASWCAELLAARTATAVVRRRRRDRHRGDRGARDRRCSRASFVAIIGVPSFVVTLAGLLALAGRDPADHRRYAARSSSRTRSINDLANDYFSGTPGADDPRARRPSACTPRATARAEGVRPPPRHRQRLTRCWRRSRLIFFTAVVFGAGLGRPPTAASRTSACCCSRLLVFWTFVAERTRFGRHVYAVGGNAEAARRAGINVAAHPHRRCSRSPARWRRSAASSSRRA